jgi:hypothetical protein
MTGSVNCEIVSKGRRDFCGVKCIELIYALETPETIHPEIEDYPTELSVPLQRGNVWTA